MASDAAARRAAKAGYTNLYEMKDGITGWAQAGMPIAHISD
jgi:rhodanese-related sulfurtransferase